MRSWVHNAKEGGSAQARDSQESITRYVTAPGETPAQKYVPMNLLNSSVSGVMGRNPTGSHEPTSIYFQIRLLLQTP